MIEQWLRVRFGNLIFTSGYNDARVNCPFCAALYGSEDTGGHLYVSLVKPVAHCFRCSWSGHWVGLIIGVDGCSYADALRYMDRPIPDIAKFESLYSPRGLVQTDKLASRPEDFRMLTFNTAGTSIEYLAVYDYAKQRLRLMGSRRRDIIQRYFGWVPGSNRIWILVDVNWWQGRTIIGDRPKYLNSPWPRGDSLWNGDALRKYSSIVMCEGVFSALHAGLNAIATCSKSMSKEQATRIAKSGVTGITLMLDADANADAYEMASDLEKAGYNGSIEIHKLYEGDPCDGLEGTTVAYNFSERVSHVLKSV